MNYFEHMAEKLVPAPTVQRFEGIEVEEGATDALAEYIRQHLPKPTTLEQPTC